MRGAAERGFVLIGVVVFVLALTILGLSLFSLSSYEAQFLGRSLNETKAFYAASGGLERAKYVLGWTGQLQSVQQNLAPEGVTWAIAQQVQGPDTDTTGAILWGGNDVQIQVTASVQGKTRTLEGWFRPLGRINYYKRVLTVTDEIIIGDISGPSNTPRCGTVRLEGAVWQKGSDLSWTGCLDPAAVPDSIRVNADVPVPEVHNFIAAHLAAASVPVYNDASRTYRLTEGAADEVHYYTTPDTGQADLTFWDGRSGIRTPVEIRLKGKAVWMLKRGMRFDAPVKIKREGPGAALIIVAEPGEDPYGYWPQPAIWFFDRVESEDVPLILISNGQVLLEHFYSDNEESEVDYLSIFASRVMLTGPRTSSGKKMKLHYDPSVQDGLIDWLGAQGALPNATGGGTGSLSIRRGSWRESGN